MYLLGDITFGGIPIILKYFKDTKKIPYFIKRNTGKFLYFIILQLTRIF